MTETVDKSVDDVMSAMAGIGRIRTRKAVIRLAKYWACRTPMTFWQVCEVMVDDIHQFQHVGFRKWGWK